MSNQVQPITPQEVVSEKARNFPDTVLECFNELIAQKFNNGYATVPQNDVVNLMLEKGLDREEIFSQGWLNVEDIYRKAGWEVTYDKPGFNETGSAYFRFGMPRKKPL